MSDTIKELKTQLETHPKDETLWLALGNAYVAANRLEDAIDAFSEGIICNPFGVDCYHMRARKYLTLRKCEFSVADFAMAARLDPDNVDNYYYQGVAAYMGKMYGKAEEALLKTIELMEAQHVEETAAAVDWLWMTYTAMGKTEQADAIAATIQKDTPCLARSNSYKKRVLLYNGTIRPEDFLDRESLKTTDRPELYLISELFGLGNYYIAKGQPEKAIPLFKEARDIPTWHDCFHYTLACDYLKEQGL